MIYQFIINIESLETITLVTFDPTTPFKIYFHSKMTYIGLINDELTLVQNQLQIIPNTITISLDNK